MDYKKMTAPCGLDCFNCMGYLASEDPAYIPQIAEALGISEDEAKKAVCRGCRPQEGQIPFLPMACNVYPCVQKKGLAFCCECDAFPCDHLHPYADQAGRLPHNTKVFNLCLIKKMGLENWGENKAAKVRESYFTGQWRL